MALMLGMLRSATSGILSAGSGAGASGAGKGGEDAPGANGDDKDDGGDAAGERKDADPQNPQSAKDNDADDGVGVDGLEELMDGAPAPCEQEDVRDADESRAPETEHVREEAPATAVSLPADPARGGIAATAQAQEDTIPATVPLEASGDALDEVENEGDSSDSNEDAAESCAEGKEDETPGDDTSLIEWAVKMREKADARTAAEAAVKSLQTSNPSGGRGRGGGKSSKEKAAAVKAKAKAKTKEPKAKAATAKVKAAAKRNAKGEPKRKGKTNVAEAPWLSHRCDVMCDHADSLMLSMLSCIRGTVDKHYQ